MVGIGFRESSETYVRSSATFSLTPQQRGLGPEIARGNGTRNNKGHQCPVTAPTLFAHSDVKEKDLISSYTRGKGRGRSLPADLLSPTETDNSDDVFNVHFATKADDSLEKGDWEVAEKFGGLTTKSYSRTKQTNTSSSVLESLSVRGVLYTTGQPYQVTFSPSNNSEARSICLNKNSHSSSNLVKGTLDSQYYVIKLIAAKSLTEMQHRIRLEMRCLHLAEQCRYLSVLHSTWWEESLSLGFLLLEHFPEGNLEYYLTKMGKNEGIVRRSVVHVLRAFATLHSSRLFHGNPIIQNVYVSSRLNVNSSSDIVMKLSNFESSQEYPQRSNSPSSTKHSDIQIFATSLIKFLTSDVIKTFGGTLQCVLGKMISSGKGEVYSATQLLEYLGICPSLECDDMENALLLHRDMKALETSLIDEKKL